MARLNVLIERGEVCHKLRTKTMFYESVVVEPDATESSSTYGPFWCGETQSLIGPDGKFANAEACRPGRGCCGTV